MRNDLGSDLQLAPKKARVALGDAGAAVEDFRGDAAVRCVLAGLTQQDAVAGTRGQAVGEDGAGGATADDDVVKLCGHGWATSVRVASVVHDLRRCRNAWHCARVT